MKNIIDLDFYILHSNRNSNIFPDDLYIFFTIFIYFSNRLFGVENLHFKKYYKNGLK